MLREVLFFFHILYLCPKFYYIFTVYLYIYYMSFILLNISILFYLI